MSAYRSGLACLILICTICAAGLCAPAAQGVKVVKGQDSVDVLLDGKLFTRYVYASTTRPYCYPIIGPTGKPVTRNFPMAAVEGETTDHPHHRSLWFTFGDMNGVDFWTETATTGKVVHRKFDKLTSGKTYGQIRTINDWIAPDGKKVCEDTRDLKISQSSSGRIMDLTVTIRATEGPVKMGDTKEGMFGMRVATSMDVDKGKGHIRLSGGETDAAAWGKQGLWCDYYGPVDGQTVGIAIMEHPKSFRHPTYWHVRTYGMFAVNPFGLKEFTGDKTRDGSYTIPKGGSVTFRYRVLIHKGDTDQADIAGQYAAYVKWVK